MENTQYTINNGPLESVQVIGELNLSDLPGATSTNLTTLIIGTTVTTIGQNAFYNCRSLTSVIIPVAVTTIGQDAFQYCTSLTSINIPAGVTTIGSGVFYSCTSLSSINFPDSVTNIGRGMFTYCTRLASVTIPNSVTSIEYLSFGLCSSLASVTFGGPLTNANIESEIFNYIGPNATRKFRFNTYDSTLINQSLLDQIKSITDDDRVSSTGPQIFILPPPPTDISNGAQLLQFLTTDAEYGNINNNIVVTGNLINTSNTLKIIINTTNALISITKS
jgi:hypothetical protein